MPPQSSPPLTLTLTKRRAAMNEVRHRSKASRRGKATKDFFFIYACDHLGSTAPAQSPSLTARPRALAAHRIPRAREYHATLLTRSVALAVLHRPIDMAYSRRRDTTTTFGVGEATAKGPFPGVPFFSHTKTTTHSSRSDQQSWSSGSPQPREAPGKRRAELKTKRERARHGMAAR